MTDVRPLPVLISAVVVLALGLTVLVAHLPTSTTSPSALAAGLALSDGDTPGDRPEPARSPGVYQLSTAVGHEDEVEPPPEPDVAPDGAADPVEQDRQAPDDEGDGQGEEVGAEPARPQGLLPVVDPDSLATIASRTGIPERPLAAYAGASMYMAEHQPECNLDWAMLAAIGRVESVHGTLGGGHIDADGQASEPMIGRALDGTGGVRAIRDTDGGELDGDPVWDRAVGPMQFIPSTWRSWGVDATGNGEADPQHIDDAALSAARYLCASGDLSDPGTWWRAVYSYNRSESYARLVLRYNNHYAQLSHG